MENPNFFKEKYDFHKASEVEKAAERTGQKKLEKKYLKNPRPGFRTIMS